MSESKLVGIRLGVALQPNERDAKPNKKGPVGEPSENRWRFLTGPDLQSNIA